MEISIENMSIVAEYPVENLKYFEPSMKVFVGRIFEKVLWVLIFNPFWKSVFYVTTSLIF